MARLPRGISGDDFVRVARRVGYVWDHTEGDHMILLHDSSRRRRRLSVPRHRELGRGLLRKLIKDAGLSVDVFVNLLRE